MKVGVLHPGLMGETLAKNCQLPTMWVAADRSPETQARAKAHNMEAVDSLAELCEQAGVIISICPPAAALDVAASVAAAGFTNLFVDANAVSPAAAREIGAMFEHFVDGSLIGPPAHTADTTRLYLSGERGDEIARLFQGSLLDARVIGAEPGAASALKMAYASWTKIGSAMQLAIRAMARAEGVDDALVDEWNISQPGMVKRSQAVAAGVAPKAWRFTGEMEQIAAAFSAVGLPAGFADAGAQIYERLAEFKGTTPDLDQVLAQLAE